MKYIVFDLEWNQSAYGRSAEHPNLPFEIIEIGAVKLNHKYQLESEFRELITPKVYRRLHHTIRKMLSYDETELRQDGHPFPEVCKRFLDWCGKDSVFCTWGMSDLFYLQNNMDFYGMEMLPYPVCYYNIQQIYADKYDPNHIKYHLDECDLKINASGQPDEWDKIFSSEVNVRATFEGQTRQVSVYRYDGKLYFFVLCMGSRSKPEEVGYYYMELSGDLEEYWSSVFEEALQ